MLNLLQIPWQQIPPHHSHHHQSYFMPIVGKDQIVQCSTLNPAPFLLPCSCCNHVVCTSPHTVSHTPLPLALYTHSHTLPAAIIPPCMFSWPVKSPSSQVPTHLLSLKQHANLNPERKCSIKWWTYLHANSDFPGPLGSRAPGQAAEIPAKASHCNTKLHWCNTGYSLALG